MNNKNKATDQETEIGSNDPIQADSIGSRIEEVINIYPSKADAAATSTLTTEQLKRWTRGQGLSTFISIAKLCAGAGISLDYIGFGNDSEKNSSQKNINSEVVAAQDEDGRYIINGVTFTEDILTIAIMAAKLQEQPKEVKQAIMQLLDATHTQSDLRDNKGERISISTTADTANASRKEA